MKKLISLFAIALLICGGAAFAAGPTGPNKSGDILGQSKFTSEPHRIFRLVRFVQPESAMAAGASESYYLSAGSLVIWDTRAGGLFGNLADGVTVTTTLTSYDSRVAGIIAVSAFSQDLLGNTAYQDIVDNNWTYLQTYGLVDNARGGRQIANSGDALSAGSTAGDIGSFGLKYNSADTGYSKVWGIAGFYYEDASIDENDVKVFLRGLD